MNDFDIERAQRGEPIQFCQSDGKWMDVHFVGQTRGGQIVVQFPDAQLLITRALRMKPASRWAVVVGSKEVAQQLLNIYNNTSPLESADAVLIELPAEN